MEEIFSNRSHGFRPNRSTHTALLEIQRMTGITWMIEGDIKGYFDNIDHHKLAEILIDKINPDQMLMNIY